ncbi:MULTISPECIES: lipopolysaccharide assembly protein LapA domain-containing protein [Pseudomonas]|jgi:uncharacterized integral membrane protein|uniref:DUF1049 domain-containing protein n=1 Tax=Pseudomonas yamanorum TaxID=515393 RepID=A0AAJ3H6A8_9PSED|nr:MULTISPECIES: lipopolysaccharide assembly protein LapA domain-containing protein [Pseudomonas]NWD44373.1 DUF1049 domain-containing protein [Pseudomonas yamanorum]
MRGVKRIALMLILLVVTLGVVAFVLENQQKVALSFLGWSSIEMPVAGFVVLSLIGGLAFGPLLGWVSRRR